MASMVGDEAVQTGLVCVLLRCANGNGALMVSRVVDRSFFGDELDQELPHKSDFQCLVAGGGGWVVDTVWMLNATHLTLIPALSWGRIMVEQGVPQTDPHIWEARTSFESRGAWRGQGSSGLSCCRASDRWRGSFYCDMRLADVPSPEMSPRMSVCFALQWPRTRAPWMRLMISNTVELKS